MTGTRLSVGAIATDLQIQVDSSPHGSGTYRMLQQQISAVLLDDG